MPFFVLFTRIGICCALQMCWMSNSVVFPTLFCGTSLGISNVLARSATFFAPWLNEVHPPIPMVCFAILCTIGAILANFLRAKEVTK